MVLASASKVMKEISLEIAILRNALTTVIIALALILASAMQATS